LSALKGRLRLSDPALYRLCVQGTIDQAWAKDYTTMMISREEPEGLYPTTILEGRVLDQAELIGLINLLYGKGLLLVSVRLLSTEASAA
jgi:hypothetical protein